MLLLVHIDSVLCVEASIHPIPAAVTKSVQPDPKLNHNDNVYQHTQTHKYIKRCAKRAAVLLTAAAPLSTPKSPPSQLPTPLPAASLRSNKLHSCVGPAWSCAAAAAQTQDGTHLPALVQRKIQEDAHQTNSAAAPQAIARPSRANMEPWQCTPCR